MDDPFVDDSELEKEIDDACLARSIKTKEGGFFVSSGELETFKHSATIPSKAR